MAQNSTNVLHPFTISIPEPKVRSLLTDLNNQDVNKSFEVDSESQDQENNVQLLKMQVQQLKRENTFLKRKIDELKVGKIQLKVKGQKKQSINCFNILKKNALLSAKDHPKQNSLSFIFTEIQNILKSLGSIHRLEIDKQLWVNPQSEGQDSTKLNLDELSFIKQCKQRKQKINKKLQMIALQKQQSQYGALLEVFSEFYQQKAQEQVKIKQKIEKFIENTLEIGKKLIQGASNKSIQRSIKSCYMSNFQKTFNEPFQFYESGNKQNFERFNLRVKTQRNEVSQSTTILGNRMDQQKCVIEGKTGSIRDETVFRE